MSEELHEFVITLKSMDDLDQFYDDMETIGGTQEVPDRIVPVYKRRPISRNTHYMLTLAEAQTLLQDDRIEGVTPAKLVADSITRIGQHLYNHLRNHQLRCRLSIIGHYNDAY